MPDNPNIANLNLELIGPGHLCELVKTFESKTSCDLDGISTKLLKHIIHEISQPLSHIFNLSISTGTFPSQLKTIRTVPIFKAGSPLLCDNYRPISLLSTLSKLMEKIFCRQLLAHLEDNNLTVYMLTNTASSTTNRLSTILFSLLISSILHSMKKIHNWHLS
jgi:hypothetical protein